MMAISHDQREDIRSLLANGLDSKKIATQIGVSQGTVAAVKAHITMGRYATGEADAAEVAEVEDAIGAAFGLERDMQLELRRDIQQLEPGLMIIDGDREKTVQSGRIDITARDTRGATVVIELKAGSADRYAIGQILSYVGDLMEDERQVRGILVAREFTPRAVSAARSVPNVRLFRYGIQFTFEAVSKPVT